jgi:hypothetical protein
MEIIMNRAEYRKYHIIYKTTCTITGKFYLGMHSTDNLNDGYLGSGSILSRSIKKYGRENHTCEVIELLQDRKSLSLREEQIITPELRLNKMCMNIRSGGTGNQPGKALKAETREKMSASLKKMWADLLASGYQRPSQTSEHIEKRVAKIRDVKRTDEQKLNMSKVQKAALAKLFSDKDYAKIRSDKVKAGLNNMSSEAKDKMLQKQIKAANNRPPMSLEHIEKCASFHRGKKRSAETVAKMSEGQVKNLASKTIIKTRQAKTWTIEKENAEIFKIINLKNFCIEQNISQSRMYKTLINRKFVSGFRALSIDNTLYEKHYRTRKEI